MTFDPRNQSPFHALPPVAVALAVAIAGVEAAFQLAQAGLLGGGREARLVAIRDWAVLDVVWEWMRATGAVPAREALRVLAYPFLHLGFGHAAMACVFVLALGNVIGDVLRGWRLLALFLVPSTAGAVAYVVLFDAAAPLVGGYPGAYGMVGAFAWLVRQGMTRLPVDPSRGLVLLGFLLAIQPVFGVITGQGLSWVPGWAAEAVGAGTGWLLAGMLLPGGGRRVLDRARRR